MIEALGGEANPPYSAPTTLVIIALRGIQVADGAAAKGGSIEGPRQIWLPFRYKLCAYIGIYRRC